MSGVKDCATGNNSPDTRKVQEPIWLIGFCCKELYVTIGKRQ